MALDGFDALYGLFGRMGGIEGVLADARALEQTGDDLLADVVAKFGHSQPGWDDLAPDTQAARARQGFAPDAPLLRAGTGTDAAGNEIQGGQLRAAYEVWRDGPDVVVGVRPESDQAVIAEVQEFGDAHVPPRPVLGTTAAEDAHLLPDRVYEVLDRLARPL